MPVRQNVQGGVAAPGLAGYQSGGTARAQMQMPGINPDAGTSGFWQGLLQGGIKQGVSEVEQAKAKAYLTGQQDSEMGRQRAGVHAFMQEAYDQGFNKANVGASLANFQLDLQQKATEYANAGRTPEEWNTHVTEETNKLLSAAGAQGMRLDNKDWQSWLNTVEHTRNTSADFYQTKVLERAQYQKQQAISAEGSAAIGNFQASDYTGNPQQALENLTAYVHRVDNDDTLSPQEKDGYTAAFLSQTLVAAKSSGAVEGVSAYMQALPQFQRLPTSVQTQIMGHAQQAYGQRAADESGEVFGYVSQARNITDIQSLNQQYPMETFAATLNKAQQERKISPSQYFTILNEETVRRDKLQKAADIGVALRTAPTMSDAASTTGMSIEKVKRGTVEMYAQTAGGYSAGGLALMQRGLQNGAMDYTAAGIEMLQQDAQGLAGIDSRNLKKDADGNPVYPEAVVNSLSNLKQAYDGAIRAGNNVQANQLLAGLPDAVAYGIRQGVDANSMASVVYRRADDLAAGRVVGLPAQMPKDILATAEDVTYGLFDTQLTQKGSARNILGIKSYVFTSAEDKKAQEVRLNQVNSALSEEYTALQQQGKLPALSGDDLKNWLIGRVTQRAVRIENGTDNGTMLILPNVGNKEAVFGSTDNGVIGQGLQERVQEFMQKNPGATSIQLRYDSMANELVFQATDKNNTLLTTSDGIPAAEVRDMVRSVQTRITNGGNGKTVGNLAVPSAGFVQFDSSNKFGIQPSLYQNAVSRLVSYEGYTDQKGFSILATHPTTGAPLNEAKYVKQPGDTPQVAANKLSMYLQDKVLPDVQGQMQNFAALPEYLRGQVFQQLVETTYHAGNAGAFGSILTQLMQGDAKGAYEKFRESPLYKDAGPTSRRNKDRMALMDAVLQYREYATSGNTYIRPPY